MTRVDQEGIPCIVQSIDIEYIWKPIGEVRVTFFDGLLWKWRIENFNYILKSQSLENEWTDSNRVADCLYSAIEQKAVKFWKNRGRFYGS